MARGGLKGGDKLKRFIRDRKRAADYQPVIEIGFGDPVIAPLAAQLEFGSVTLNLPERPAFRQGIDRLKRDLPEVYRRVLKRDGGLTEAGAAEIASGGRDIIKDAYLAFEGGGLSERQEARKRGTAGAWPGTGRIGRPKAGRANPRLCGRPEGRLMAPAKTPKPAQIGAGLRCQRSHNAVTPGVTAHAVQGPHR